MLCIPPAFLYAMAVILRKERGNDHFETIYLNGD